MRHLVPTCPLADPFPPVPGSGPRWPASTCPGRCPCSGPGHWSLHSGYAGAGSSVLTAQTSGCPHCCVGPSRPRGSVCLFALVSLDCLLILSPLCPYYYPLLYLCRLLLLRTRPLPRLKMKP